MPINHSARDTIPTLLQYGIDLTRQAREGMLVPVVGRDEEIELLVETLCRRTKRNPLLVGSAGVGKTAIVEGVAQRVVNGHVPAIPPDSIIILLQPSLIVSGGGGNAGELEKRMTAILSEATQKGVLLFIDELHVIIGAGGHAGTADIASLMKPALARGEIACIAATTDDEYRRYIETDAALERRFQPIRVQEMNSAQVLAVLQTVRDDLKKIRGVDVSDEVLLRLIDSAEKHLRNRSFPDKAVDLLEQCVANALVRGDKDVDLREATAVVERMVGMPRNIGLRIDTLRQVLAERGLLSDTGREALAGRLQVTMRGLDIRHVRPNAVILLAGNSAARGEELAGAICGALFEAPERIVKVDTGRYTSQHDITLLLGAPPGYVGHNEVAPLHRLKQHPWCVVLLENIDTCHQSIQQVLGQAFADGYFTDGQNRKIYLSDAVVLLTTPGIERKSAKVVGFGSESNQEGGRELLRRNLGASIGDAVDVICFEMGESSEEWSAWLCSGVLKDITDRFCKLGVTIQWDDSIFGWIDAHCADRSCIGELERLIDQKLSPKILACIEYSTGGNEVMIVKRRENVILIERR